MLVQEKNMFSVDLNKQTNIIQIKTSNSRILELYLHQNYIKKSDFELIKDIGNRISIFSNKDNYVNAHE